MFSFNNQNIFETTVSSVFLACPALTAQSDQSDSEESQPPGPSETTDLGTLHEKPVKEQKRRSQILPSPQTHGRPLQIDMLDACCCSFIKKVPAKLVKE
jgi:hypothetical protein